jgi:hypothetical protein
MRGLVPYRSDLQCEVISLSYDFEKCLGTLQMAPFQNCDMGTCISLFERIDRRVVEVITFAGTTMDTSYKRGAEGWQVLRSAN